MKEEKKEEENECGCGMLAVILAVLGVMMLLVIFTPDNEPSCYYRETINSPDGYNGLFKTQDVDCPKILLNK